MLAKFLEVFGWIATACLLLAYFAITQAWLTIDHPIHPVLNIVGGLGIMAVSAYKKAWQPAVVNVFWTSIAVLGLIKIL